jgi:hypothetical protein
MFKPPLADPTTLSLLRGMVSHETPMDARIDAYVTDIVRVASGSRGSLVSVILFGSASTGGYADGLSDLDLLLILTDDTDPAEKERIGRAVRGLEALHRFTKPQQGKGGALGAMQSIANRVTANARTFFICTKADLLSGDSGQVLDLPKIQAVFIDRIAVPSILSSGVTLWGENLLPQVRLPPIRRIDVGKSFFGLFNQLVFVIAAYSLLPGATRYALDILKRSVHSCYFCHHGRSAAISVEVGYFERRYGEDPALQRLLSLRREYRRSFPFVLHSLRAIVRLHFRTARDVEFPLEVQVDKGDASWRGVAPVSALRAEGGSSVRSGGQAGEGNDRTECNENGGAGGV